MDGEDRIEEVRKSDSLCFRDEAKKGAVPIETPGAALLDYLETGFVMAVEERIRNPAGRILVGQLQGFRAKPLHTDDGGKAIRKDASHARVGFQVLKSAHVSALPDAIRPRDVDPVRR